ncbi:MAG: efflux transporter outer rane subunit [Gammaproteobacteria bacterium]|jgi:NodT family efflux transporter outer membrane factor (OMF) lipoprotein|nr:efflux transporter outer rane subunit [Gammaproteobacteria bacterium]
MKFLLSPLFCLILLSACTVGPDFKTPPPPPAQSYTAEDEALSTEQHVLLGQQIQSEWWTLFSSPPLNDVIKQAVANNYDMTTAKERVAQANEVVRAEQGNLFPQVSLGATAGNQLYGVALFGPVNFSIPAFTYYELGPTLTWTPDLFGGTRRSIEQQKAYADYQTQQLNATYITLTGNVVALSLTLATTQAELNAVSQIIDEDKKNLQLIQAAFEAGANSKMEILDAKRQLENDEVLLPPLQQQLSTTRHALAILVGKSPANWTPPDFALSDFVLPQTLPVSLPSELVRKRPDILAAEANLHAASAAIGIATANLYPSLTLTGNTLQEALTPASLFESNSTAWGVAASLTAPIFSGGTLSAQKRAAVHAYQAALAQYQQTILHAFAEVADDLSALQHDDATLMAQQLAFSSAEASLLLVEKSYQDGNTDSIHVHEAKRQLAAAQRNLILAQSQRFTDTAQLFISLGGSPATQ